MPARAILLSVLLLAASCAPKRGEFGTDVSRASPGELLRELHSRRAQLSTLTGRGELTFESPERSGSAFFRFAMRRSDSLLVRLQGPFGMEVGSFLLTSSGFLFYNAIENSVHTGDPSGARFRSLIPIAMEQGELMDLFAGQLPLPRDSAGVAFSRTPEGALLLSREDAGGGSVRYTIDAEELTVIRVEILDAAGSAVGEAEAMEFREIDGVPLPRRIRASTGGGAQSLALYFTSQAVNGPSPSFQVAIPSSARRSSR